MWDVVVCALGSREWEAIKHDSSYSPLSCHLCLLLVLFGLVLFALYPGILRWNLAA